MKLKFVFFLFVSFNEKVGLTAAKRGLNEFLWSRFLNVAPSDSCAAQPTAPSRLDLKLLKLLLE